MSLASLCETAFNQHPKKDKPVIRYGTAGFRSKAQDLDHVVFRTALLATLRSKYCKASIGLMITASHNPEEDNGVKLIDPMGEMLVQDWEQHATLLANCSDDQLEETINFIIENEGIDMKEEANILLGYDTRKSSPDLAQAAVDAFDLMDCCCKNFGLLTTPQLHYLVRCQNTQTYGATSEEGYYIKLGSAFNELIKEARSNNMQAVYVDGANGVGALKLKQFKRNLLLEVDVYNDGSSGQLNHKCGADYVKIEQTFPEGMVVQPGWKCCSYDGDADRIVYFYKDLQEKFHLLDGDKIAVLLAMQIKSLLERSSLELKLGIVQTAYANGSSTRYLAEVLKLPVACTPTGVKHLHHKAKQMDIGIYFEANGHGTVLFSERAFTEIGDAIHDKRLSKEQQHAANRLKILIDLVNQTVGDALSDMLLVEYCLASLGWKLEDWDSVYADLPNRQLKIKVKDRNVITTTDAERKVTAPAGLQEAIDKTVSNFNHGRSFVRPSGTEDIVRVYAEADTQESADLLANQVAALVRDMAGGLN